MDFNIAAEEMRRLAKEPTDSEKLLLYGLYKQAIHGNIPSTDDYPRPIGDNNEWAVLKYNAWCANVVEMIITNQSQQVLGKTRGECEKEYVEFAEDMIKKYERKIIRSKWNSEVWSVDY
ncbi:unnamed protein product [Anisakis simplex]|uniref:ACB domain-containing protein n=1 Tax=Anisakis simplex TaxID=6269 RepID=A0A0M3JTB7_ANISI|nr:unnamed protein product [Anisakis simplex]